ncbi:hypothetical protein CBL_10025 [Carabus blaptoides fortunei]
MATPTGQNLAKKERNDKGQPSQQYTTTSVDKVLSYLGTRSSCNQDGDEIDMLFKGYAKTMLMEQEMLQLNEGEAAQVTRPAKADLQEKKTGQILVQIDRNLN